MNLWKHEKRYDPVKFISWTDDGLLCQSCNISRGYNAVQLKNIPSQHNQRSSCGIRGFVVIAMERNRLVATPRTELCTDHANHEETLQNTETRRLEPAS